MDYTLHGDEKFTLNGQETEMNTLDFWRWHYCDRFDLFDSIAEYTVAKALGLQTAYNTGSWTLFDILYREKRIEVKSTAYYHSWQTDEEEKCKSRNFRITKAYSVYQDNTSTYERQNDIYIFCLNKGNTRKEADPLCLEHWEYYVVPTSFINKQCGDAKTLSLSRLRTFVPAIGYEKIKETVDRLIDAEA